MELATEVQELVTLLPQLPIDRLGFATSLINQFSRKGTLTPNQMPWVTKLVAIPIQDGARVRQADRQLHVLP